MKTLFMITLCLVLGGVQSEEDERIIGGQISKDGKWPFMAIIFIGETQFCGGVVFNSRYILTAAHCVCEKKALKPSSAFEIYLGHSDITNRDSQYTFTANELIRHRDYDPVTFTNDIAVIRLDREIDFEGKHSKVSCVCDPFPLDQLNTSNCVALGWGLTRNNDITSRTNQLREVELPILGDRACSEKDPDFNSHWNLCAVNMEMERDSCKGDSGGPLLCSMKISPKVYSLAGIVSFGRNCGNKRDPGYYTRVDRFIGWIKAQTGES